mmetsp:Transcript_16775/g.67690  ORF Transcript_16775/g.67690 Transcript_16775/m.67690 type:complete len:287 (+) Transcript_16775:209-1069(+)
MSPSQAHRPVGASPPEGGLHCGAHYSKGAGSAGPVLASPNFRTGRLSTKTSRWKTSNETPLSRSLRLTDSAWSGPTTSTTILIWTRSTAEFNQVRSWNTSFTEAPASLRTVVRRWRPPERSETSATKRTSLSSAARPRSRTRPSVVVSMLPPQSGTTTLLPWTWSWYCPPGRIGASPAAPPPSTTTFSCSNSRSTESATSRSSTRHTSSVNALATSNAFAPTVGTASPSASVEVVGAWTGAPADSASVNDAHACGSTPTTLTLGRSVLTASATPASSPAPPHGTMT